VQKRGAYFRDYMVILICETLVRGYKYFNILENYNVEILLNFTNQTSKTILCVLQNFIISIIFLNSV
jgi:hypothetical protein